MQRGYRPRPIASLRFPRRHRAAVDCRASPVDGVPTGEFILGYPNHYGSMPPTPVVPRELDPARRAAAARRTRITRAGAARSRTPRIVRGLPQAPAGRRRILAVHEARSCARGARTMPPTWSGWRRSASGRWPSGAPLVLAPDRDDPQLRERDDFLYARRSRRARLPARRPRPSHQPARRAQAVSGRAVAAHDGGASPAAARRAPTARRSSIRRCSTCTSVAGRRAALARDRRRRRSARGIHFFCVNASIRSQFEFVQQTWCNNPRFGGLNDNKDPIIGDQRADGRAAEPHDDSARPLAAPHLGAAAVRDRQRRRVSVHAECERASVSGGDGAFCRAVAEREHEAVSGKMARCECAASTPRAR